MAWDGARGQEVFRKGSCPLHQNSRTSEKEVLPMRDTGRRPAVAALLMLTELMGGCGAPPLTSEEKGTGTHLSQGDGGSQSPQPPPPFAGDAEVVTGTTTPHKQKDAPVETERISGKQLEEAGASHVGQVLQDVPAIQPRR